ncbi:CopG family transcriptional regulator [Clostridium sp. 'deep sea']|uniref:CopG family transcriptional regulator n=1 Tax=Clostridium sp. 'deep sea' TaxID=2779445 RepID=UPI001896A455|nr:CopG family transcriptional regulator [Clostridium sp. 'deep sea']QOR34835.1 CopG family transcriptional regulator [Clostridium sp. 'deep sea']
MEKRKRGRPTNSPKNKTIKFRIDEDTEHKLIYCSEELKISKSQILREGVTRIYDDLTKK